MNEKFKYLPQKIYENHLKSIIENNFNLSSDEYKIKYSEGASSKGDNYIGIIYRAEIIQKNKEIISIIVKLPPNSPERRNEFFLHESFVNEAEFYEKIYRLYLKLQVDKKIDIKSFGFCQVPVCYKSLTEEPYEGLYFEDLRARNFKVFDRSKDLTKDHVLLVMKVLAKLHGSFYCLKHQNPSIIKSYRTRKDYFIKRCERKGSIMRPWYESSRSQALEVIEKCGNEQLVKKVNSVLDQDILLLFKNCLDLNSTEPYATLCHGDCWNGNIMYKYNKDGLPIDIRLLDFQIMRYASPVCDLMYYIFSCTTKSLRDNYYQDFLDVYYDTLSDFIGRLGFDSQKIFPRRAFEDHLSKFGKFGLIMGVLVLPVFTSDANEVPDMDEFVTKCNDTEINGNGHEGVENGCSYVTEKTYAIYAERLLGVCEDMCRLGYI